MVNKFSTNRSGHTVSLRRYFWHKFFVIADWISSTQLDDIQSPSDENLFTIIFLRVFKWIYNPIYTVKGVSCKTCKTLLCRTCNTLHPHFRLMALNLTSSKKPTAMSRVLSSSKSETFVPSNIICNSIKLIRTGFFGESLSQLSLNSFSLLNKSLVPKLYHHHWHYTIAR